MSPNTPGHQLLITFVLAALPALSAADDRFLAQQHQSERQRTRTLTPAELYERNVRQHRYPRGEQSAVTDGNHDRHTDNGHNHSRTHDNPILSQQRDYRQPEYRTHHENRQRNNARNVPAYVYSGAYARPRTPVIIYGRQYPYHGNTVIVIEHNRDYPQQRVRRHGRRFDNHVPSANVGPYPGHQSPRNR